LSIKKLTIENEKLKVQKRASLKNSQNDKTSERRAQEWKELQDRLDAEKSLAESFKKEAQLHRQEIGELQLKVSRLHTDAENLNHIIS